MGGLFSTEEPRPPAMLRKPWRKIYRGWLSGSSIGHFLNKSLHLTVPDRENETILQFVNNYRPQTEGQQLRILLFGMIGAGKSSFINSVQSVLLGRIFTQALVDNISHESFTKKYTNYEICKEGSQSVYPFAFSDIMGLQLGGGVLVDDIKLALRGHVRFGYKFNPNSQLPANDQFYISHPTSHSKVQVLALVFPAPIIGQLSVNMLQRLWEIRMEASSLDIPQVAIITKIDEFSELISANVQNVYWDASLKKKIEQFSGDVGIPMNCIFPVKNYKSEIDLNGDIDLLILSALKSIINYGDDFINFKQRSERLVPFGTDNTVTDA